MKNSVKFHFLCIIMVIAMSITLCSCEFEQLKTYKYTANLKDKTTLDDLGLNYYDESVSEWDNININGYIYEFVNFIYQDWLYDFQNAVAVAKIDMTVGEYRFKEKLFSMSDDKENFVLFGIELADKNLLLKRVDKEYPKAEEFSNYSGVICLYAETDEKERYADKLLSMKEDKEIAEKIHSLLYSDSKITFENKEFSTIKKYTIELHNSRYSSLYYFVSVDCLDGKYYVLNANEEYVEMPNELFEAISRSDVT